MRVSASTELICQLAAREAIGGHFGEIEPDHFCLALMKFSEFPVGEIEKMGPGGGIGTTLANEVKSLQEEFESRGVDVKRMRRKLRGHLGKGESWYEGGQLHRSHESRKMFKLAEGFAQHTGDETLTAGHLLEAILVSPTKAMEEVLGDAVRTRPLRPGRKKVSPGGSLGDAVRTPPRETPKKPQDDIPWEL